MIINDYRGYIGDYHWICGISLKNRYIPYKMGKIHGLSLGAINGCPNGPAKVTASSAALKRAKRRQTKRTWWHPFGAPPGLWETSAKIMEHHDFSWIAIGFSNVFPWKSLETVELPKNHWHIMIFMGKTLEKPWQIMAPSSPSVRSTAALRCFHKRPRVHPVVVGDQTLEIRGLIRVGRHQYLSEEDIASLGMNQAVQTCTSDIHNVNKYIYIIVMCISYIYIYNYVHIHIFIYIYI